MQITKFSVSCSETHLCHHKFHKIKTYAFEKNNISREEIIH